MARRSRAAATLTEVLMALLIMAVGVVSVFTLFPISVLRSIRATQLTNAKIHVQNTRESIAVSPYTLSRFSGFAPLNYRDQWRPGTMYAADDVVVPSVKPGHQFPAPFFWYRCTTAGTSSALEPTWDVQGGTTNDATAVWTRIPTFQYVVDPIGWNVATADSSMPPNEFGNKTDVTTGAGVTPPGGALDRINGGFTSELSAALSTALPDSWQDVLTATPLTVTDADPTGPTFGEAVFPPSVDLTGIGGFRRIVFTSDDGRMTVTRDILPQTGTPATSGIDGQTVRWAAQLPFPFRFPGAGGNPVVGLARIESFDRRYSWFITLKKDASGRTDAKVVVVFRRGFSAEDEHVYDANFGNPNIDINGDGNADLGSANQVSITWTIGAEPSPLLKPGSFLFDARNADWYRIRSIDDTTANAATLSLDRTVQSITPGDGSGPPEMANPPGRAMLMKRIIGVYDL